MLERVARLTRVSNATRARVNWARVDQQRVDGALSTIATMQVSAAPIRQTLGAVLTEARQQQIAVDARPERPTIREIAE